jgi:hypothetical protein
MVVIKFATYTNRCPFSKNIIHPTNKICLFNPEQFEAFKKLIQQALSTLPEELVDLIIEKTGYKKLQHQFGLIKYTHWTTKYIPKRNIKINRKKEREKEIIEFAKLTAIINESVETDETDTDDDYEEVSEETEETDSY